MIKGRGFFCRMLVIRKAAKPITTTKAKAKNLKRTVTARFAVSINIIEFEIGDEANEKVKT